MSVLLRGADVAAALDEGTASRARALAGRGVVSKLAIVRVGAKAGDLAYERGAMKHAEKCGVSVLSLPLPEDVTSDELTRELYKLDEDAGVHGVLLFRPLPPSLDEDAVCRAVSPAKDVDGMTSGAMARVYSGSGAGWPPCTAASVMAILRHYGISPAGRRVCVIGRSLVTGRPLSLLLTAADATVTLCHSKTKDLPSVTRECDIVVAALGRAEMLGREYFRAGQTVIDIGISWSQAKNRLVGDVDFDSVKDLVSAITPVPGGVGGVTAAMLCRHAVEAAEAAL